MGEGELAGVIDGGGVGLVVAEEEGGDFTELIGVAREPAGVGEGDAVDGAVAAYAGEAGQKGIAGYLAGDGAAVQLEEDAMAGDEAQVIWVWEAALDDLEICDAGGLDALAAGAAIFVDDSDGGVKAGGEEEGGGVIAGGDVPLASADEDAGAIRERKGEIPLGRLDGVGSGDEADMAAAGGAVDAGEVGSAGDAAAGDPANLPEEAEVGGGGEELGDLVKAAFLEGDGDLSSTGFQLAKGLEAMLEVAAQDEEDGALRGGDAGGIAVEGAAGAGGVGVVVEGRVR